MTDATPTPGLDALVAIATALADAAKQCVAAMESMQQFADAHKAATTAGQGVTVVRRPDGTITTTASVHLEAGTALFMDEPGPATIPALHFPPPAAPLTTHGDYHPRYTTAPNVA